MRAAARGDAMRNGDILWNTREGKERETERGGRTNSTYMYMYNRRYLSRKILFVLLHISSLFYFC